METTDLTDLVCAAKQGDRAAFEQLVTRYERAVYATVFRRLRNHADAQELTQEVFVQVLRKIHQLHDPRCFGGWLQAIAGRMAINRMVRRRPVVSDQLGDFAPNGVDDETPLGHALARERCDQVHAGLGRLGSLDRDTLVAFYFRGRSLLEMSDDFQSPVGTIKRRLHVARKRLAQELEALAPA
jgi:RNA polymerase sigma-70 factor (ECF subfamily)